MSADIRHFLTIFSSLCLNLIWPNVQVILHYTVLLSNKVLLGSDDINVCAFYCLGSLLLFITLTLICTTSCTVNVTYLRGVPRLSNTSYWDYYFFCNTVGTTLLWEVNGTGLNGFLSGEVGQAFSGSMPNFAYTASLLSSKPTTDGQFTFDSILIVSVLGSFSLDVVCRNGSSSNRTSNVYNGKGVENSNSTNSIYEEYLLTDGVVGDKTSQTSIFICEVQNSFMYWRTGTSNSELGFSKFDNVGRTRRNLEQGATIVEEVAIITAKEPYRIVSVFLCTDTSSVTATCGYNSQNEVSLTSRYDSSSSVPTVQTDPEIVSSSSTSVPTVQTDPEIVSSTTWSKWSYII